jgi:hypothetical protein
VVEQITLHKYLDCVHTGEFGEGRWIMHFSTYMWAYQQGNGN